MIHLKQVWVALFLLLLFFSCDDRLLRKTVSLESLSGTLSYEPHRPTLSGNLIYKIRNKQSESLSEIYLFCHPSVQIEFLAYNHQAFRFEQWIGFGYGLYRIKIPEFRPDATATLEIKFSITGPITENRFSITKDGVFLDAKKVWLPLPFAETPKFSYNITLKTPSEYRSILGAKSISETSNRSERTIKWKSEIDNPLITGNLAIIKSEIQKSKQVTLYTTNLSVAPPVLSNSEKIINLFKDKIGSLPFSHYYIVDQIVPYKDMETFINGEFLGNMLHISPELLDNPSLLSLDSSLQDKTPILMDYDYLNVVETIAHEISHSYFGGIIQFDEDQMLDAEVITEFLALNAVRKLYPEKFPSLINRNRFILINLLLHNKTDNLFWNYLYGVNLLQAAFSSNKDGIFDLTQALLEKYRYTQMSMNDIQITIDDLNREIETKNQLALQEWNTRLSNNELETNKPPIPTPLYEPNYLSLYKQKKLFNTRILLSNSILSNTKTPITQQLVLLQNKFPISITGPLSLSFKNSTATNYSIALKPNSQTAILLSNKQIKKASFLPPSLCVEYQQSDNRIPTSDFVLQTETILSNYAIKTDSLALNTRPSRKGWVLASVSHPPVLKTGNFVKIDQIFSNQDLVYAIGYKWFNTHPLSYAIFKLKSNPTNPLSLQEVFDPSLK